MPPIEDRPCGCVLSQAHVYNHTARLVVRDVLNGFNATVFCYGATGAGKTHTMVIRTSSCLACCLTLDAYAHCGMRILTYFWRVQIGSQSSPGVMVQTMRDLFARWLLPFVVVLLPAVRSRLR